MLFLTYKLIAEKLVSIEITRRLIEYFNRINVHELNEPTQSTIMEANLNKKKKCVAFPQKIKKNKLCTENYDKKKKLSINIYKSLAHAPSLLNGHIRMVIFNTLRFYKLINGR